MIAIFYYLLKVIFCSGILYGYYQLALRNKVFHEWNRFYLLAIIPLSVLLPLLNLHIISPADSDSKILTAMQIVAGADEYFTNVNNSSSMNISWELMAMVIYALVSMSILIVFTAAIIKIRKMIKRYSPIYLDDVLFLNTKEQGTPFSFFKYLLWNEEISLDSDAGKRIMEHELVHIREKHSWDKIFVHISLVLFWTNPFFWLVRKELTMIHEFIADRKTVGSGDVKAFAKLILQASFPQHANLLTNSFFQSSIKRRLSMITKQNNPRISYLSRLMMIPVLFVLVFTFGVKANNLLSDPTPVSVKLDKKYTVVVDAGHGGSDNGAINGSLKEKDLALSMALLVKSLSKNPNINIVLSRSTDILQPVKDKVSFTEQAKADLFLSLHVNSAQTKDSSGMMAYISARNMDQNEKNIRFASLILNNLSQVYKTDLTIKQRKSQGVWVLDQNSCPAALIECGYISNKADRTFISNTDNQTKIAEKIVRSIEEYFSNDVTVRANTTNSPGTLNKEDTIPAEKKSESEKTSTGVKEASSSVFKFTADSVRFHTDTTKIPANTVYLINGQEVSTEIANSIDPNKISSIDVIKNDGKSLIKITLKDPKLSEVTVIGYGSKKAEGNKSPATKEPITVKGYQIPPLFILDGVESTEEVVKKMDPNSIASVDVLKGEMAEKKYGDKGKYGVIELKTKK